VSPAPLPVAPLARTHLRAGFAGLLLFVVLGALLETLHAFKSPAYLDVGNETRRLMWRLAHAHGTLLSLVNVVYALAVDRWPVLARPWASRGLLGSLALLPFGFFAGGVVVHGGDPGLPVVLVPLGALALVVALTSIVVALARSKE
jgi:hypothetical protein